MSILSFCRRAPSVSWIVTGMFVILQGSAFCLDPLTFLRKPHMICVFFSLLPALSYQHPLLESDAGKKARSSFMWKVIFSLHHYFVVNQTLHFGPKLCMHVGKGRPPEATGDIVQELLLQLGGEP